MYWNKKKTLLFTGTEIFEYSMDCNERMFHSSSIYRPLSQRLQMFTICCVIHCNSNIIPYKVLKNGTHKGITVILLKWNILFYQYSNASKDNSCMANGVDPDQTASEEAV